MDVNFYLKGKNQVRSAIDAIVRFKGQRYKISTGVSVEVAYWDKTAKRAVNPKNKYPDAEIINVRLTRAAAAINLFFEPYIIRNTAPPQHEARKALKPPEPESGQGLFVPYMELYHRSADYAAETIKKYKTACSWLKKYEQHHRQALRFDDINLKFYQSFRHYFFTSKKGDEDYYSANYFGSLVKCIKRAMGAAAAAGLHKNTVYRQPEFRTESETSDSVYLTVDELLAIHAFEATTNNISEICKDLRSSNRERKAAALNLAKNKFLVGCFTALRVSDFNRLREVNIADGFIRIKPRKGTRKNEDVVIPVHRVVREIIATGFDIATPISEQKLNRHIKEVCQLVKINAPVVLGRTEGGRVVERTFEKWEKISTHTARRSGATNMFKAGIPSISIMRITGHTTERSFLKYIRISNEENAEILRNHSFFQ